MKTRIVAGLVASLVLFVSTGADAGTKRHRGHGATRPASVTTPVSSPAAPSKNTASPRSAKTAKVSALSRFLASGVPLAEVREGRLKSVASAKRPCGLARDWAKIGSLWTPLDAWGQAISKSESAVRDRRLYEGSGCYEVSFPSSKDAGEAPRLYVAKGSGYSPAPSAKWSPDSDTQKRFERLYHAQVTSWVDSKSEPTSARGRVMFFHLPKQDGSPEGAPTERRPVHWAVAGGRVLVVGYVGASGAWKVGHVLPPNGKEHAYEPVAVLDMNGDGLPEIVVHEEAGGVFTDRVLSFDAGAMRWERIVESPGGASR